MDVYSTTSRKKTIYDTAEQATVPPPAGLQTAGVPRLVGWIGDVRQEGADLARMIRQHGQLLVDRWISTEKRIAATVERTVPRGEKLVPGIIYVGVASLAGPIFTRKRNFAIRWISPLVFASAASFYFLPGTANVVLRNIWGRYGDPATVDEVRDKWRAMKVAESRFRTRITDIVQEIRLALQEGRSFGPREIRKEVEKTEEYVAGIASAAIDNIKKDVGSKSTYDNVLELPEGVAIANTNEPVPVTVPVPQPEKRLEKKKLPLGFKDKAD
ncbi:hypothetical protein EV175_000384 [Coemansia sp. RSA 1933]|nr:hypothetical protein EV175_000384 [Coemansia sp. RSA 1933]